VPVQYAVVEASDLIPSQTPDGTPNPQYPPELQPRDRTRAASQAQVASIAQNLDPRLLGPSPTASDGAPVVGPSGVVESGNGRVLAIQRAYADNMPSARAYRSYLEKQGYSTQGMDAPVLVRVRQGEMTPADRLSFVREANQSGTLGYSATERAMVDAATLPDSALDLYRGGDVEQAQNREFVKAFMNTLPQSEHAGMVDANGALSQDAIRRIRGALLAKAYGDPDLVAGVVESPDSNIKAIGGALTDSAADWAKMRSAAARGVIPAGLDRTGNLLDAVRLVQRARNEGRNIAEFVGQGDIFSGRIDPDSEAWLRLMFRNTKDWTQPTGRERFAGAVRFYTQEAMKADAGANLFGMEPTRAPNILALAREKQNAGSAGPGAAGPDEFRFAATGPDGARADSARADGSSASAPELTGRTGLPFDHGEGVPARRAAGEEFGASAPAALRSQNAGAARIRSAAYSAATDAVEPEAAKSAIGAGEQLAQAARETVSNADASRAMRDTAQRLQGSDLSDDALALARGPAPRAPADDPSLLQFLIDQGGVKDPGSIGVTPRDRPGLVRRSGQSAEQLAQLASDAGYLPRGKAASVDDLARAVRSELDGRKVYARNGSFGNPEARAAFEDAMRTRERLQSGFKQLGLDPESMTDDDLRAAVDGIADAPRDGPPVQNDFTEEAIENAKSAAVELDRQGSAEQSIAAAAENDLRAQFADRMDDPVYVGDGNSVREVPARDVFDELSEGDKLVNEFSDCVGGG